MISHERGKDQIVITTNGTCILRYMPLHLYKCELGLWFMVFNATFNNISAISWR